MNFLIDEKNWETYRMRVLDNKDFSPDQKKFLKKEFSKTHRLMKKMIQNEDDARILRMSMTALSQFFTFVYRLTGISATASNFIVLAEEEDI